MWIKESLEGTRKVLCLQQGPKEGSLLHFSRHRESRLSLEQDHVARVVSVVTLVSQILLACLGITPLNQTFSQGKPFSSQQGALVDH